MEWITRTLDFIAKFSWAIMIVSAFVLFVPDEAAKQIAIFDIRESYKGGWWIVFILCCAIWISSVFKYLDSKIPVWLNSRGKKKEKIERAEQQKTNIYNRLDALDGNEQLWIKYCLYHNTQTLSAQRADHVAQSLTFKGILVEGSGHILDLPFHIPDGVWEILKENEARLLPEDDRNNPRFEHILQRFREGRHAF